MPDDPHRRIPRLIVVSGPPAAGKTTLAEALRERLGLPLVAKDTLKEALGGALGTVGRDESSRLGGAVHEAMRVVVTELLAQGVSVIAEANFTRRSWLLDGLPPCSVVQVHVSAEPAVLRERLRERDTHRHPVHYDREAADEIAARTAGGEWDALPLDGELIRIDTTDGFPDPDTLPLA